MNPAAAMDARIFRKRKGTSMTEEHGPPSSSPHPRRAILFVNDRGVGAGAGIATMRQMQSLLNAGHSVGLAYSNAASPQHADGALQSFRDLPGNFLGLFPLSPVLSLAEPPKLDWLQDRAFDQLATAISEIAPDLVIFSNLHGANWPVRWLLETRKLGVRVAAYTHDLFFLTGRCAHPLACVKYLTMCDETCPSPWEYPVQLPHLLSEQWQQRQDAFTGPDPIPILTNSTWTTDKVRRRFPKHPHIHCLHLGLDDIAFTPHNREYSRHLLDLPPDRFVVLICAQFFGYGPKGCGLLRTVIDGLMQRLPDAHILLIGNLTGGWEDLSEHDRITHHTNVRTEWMPVIFSASDLYVMFSLAETFGQTALEASACAIPVVAFAAGGIVDIARNGVNAITIEDFSPETLLTTVRELHDDGPRRRALGRAGRRLVSEHFSMEAQSQRWEDELAALFPPEGPSP